MLLVRMRGLPGFSLVIKTGQNLMNVPKLLIKVFQVFNDQTDFLLSYEPFIGEH